MKHVHVQLLTVVCLVGAGLGCSGPIPPPQPPVANRVPGAIEIVPSIVHVAPDEEFELLAAVRDEDGHLLPEFVRDANTGEITGNSDVTVTWTLTLGAPDWSEWGVTDSPHNHRRRVRGPASGGAAQATIIAEVGGESAVATLHLVEPPPVPGQNIDPSIAISGSPPLIQLPHAVGAPPAALVMDVPPNATQLDDFVQAAVGLVRPGPSSVALTGDIRLAVLPAVSGAWYGDLTVASGAVAPAPHPTDMHGIQIVPWLATKNLVQGDINDFLERIKNEVDFANHIYGQNRAGIRFEIWNDMIHQIPTASTITSTSLCDVAAKKVAELSAGPDTTWRAIHVVYLQYGNSIRGLTCADWKGRRASIIRIWLDASSPATLAHELGHALGIRANYFPHSSGHPNNDTDYDGSNVMWDGLPKAQAVSQRRVSLAQAVHMNVDSSSWLQRAVVTPDDPGSAKVRSIGLVEKCWTAPKPCPKPPVDLDDAQ